MDTLEKSKSKREFFNMARVCKGKYSKTTHLVNFLSGHNLLVNHSLRNSTFGTNKIFLLSEGVKSEKILKIKVRAKP